MCDPMSLAKGISQIGGGLAASIIGKGQADWALGLSKAQALMAMAEASSSETAIRRDYAEAARKNVAAIAMSGLSAESFAGVMKGNTDDMNRTIGTMMRSARSTADATLATGQMEASMARLEGKAALWAGLQGAAQTAIKGEMGYLENRLGGKSGPESRMEYFKRSFTAWS